MTELLGQKGFLTNILGIGAFIPGLLFIILVGYVVVKDLPTMDRQGRYMNFFFQNRKKEWKAMLTLWLASAILLVSAAIASKL